MPAPMNLPDLRKQSDPATFLSTKRLTYLAYCATQASVRFVPFGGPDPGAPPYIRDKIKEADGYAVWKPILRAVRELSWGRFTEPDARAQFVFIDEDDAGVL